MTSTEHQKRLKLKEDLFFYASNCLKIRTKADAVQLLKINRAQQYIHQQLEQQKRKTGKVRALILKGRQQGCSTYVEARFFHKVTHNRGLRAFILTHMDDATQNIFGMAKRFYDNLPSQVKPQTSATNAKELIFNKLDSGYRVGTAKSTGTGRSDTIQLFHGSEVAYWHDAESHFMGAVQAVPDAEGTEIILESTANGVGGRFYDMVLEAIAGRGEYQLIFIPWFWSAEYAQPVPKGFEITPEEEKLVETYRLSEAQLQWRRNKITELGSESMFKQEYPCNPHEAFMYSGQEPFIPVDLVETAASNENVRAHGLRILGVDVATREGPDNTAMALRQGRVVHWATKHPDWGPSAAFREVIRLFEEGEIDLCYVDKNGVGYGLYDDLQETKYAEKVIGVNSGESAIRSDEFVDRRSEMYGNLLDWLKDGPVQIPNIVSLKQDMVTPGWRKQAGKKKIESKDEIKKRIKRSTDEGDAVMLTVADLSGMMVTVEDTAFDTPARAVKQGKPRIGGLA